MRSPHLHAADQVLQQLGVERRLVHGLKGALALLTRCTPGYPRPLHLLYPRVSSAGGARAASAATIATGASVSIWTQLAAVFASGPHPGVIHVAALGASSPSPRPLWPCARIWDSTSEGRVSRWGCGANADLHNHGAVRGAHRQHLNRVSLVHSCIHRRSRGWFDSSLHRPPLMAMATNLLSRGSISPFEHTNESALTIANTNAIAIAAIHGRPNRSRFSRAALSGSDSPS